MTTPTWDRDAVHQAVRARHRHYSDEVDRLMKEEAKLLPLGGEKALERVSALNTSILTVEKHGGDATALKAQADELRRQRDINAPLLVAVQLRLSRARECLKWADMAYDGMHWLCLAESRYEK